MRVEFLEDTSVNNGIFKKGEQANFTKNVAQNFIDTNKAIEVKEEQKVPSKNQK